MSTLQSIQIGRPRTLCDDSDPDNREWTTSFFKEPIAGPIHLGATDLVGDEQADLTVHGGPDKAVCCYSADHYPQWKSDLGLEDFPHGAFGENFTISDQREEDVAIGDVFDIGETRVQVSQPRQPCWKLARRWRIVELPGLVVMSGRTGWYFRVLREGTVRPGDAVVLRERIHPEWTVARANDVMHRRRLDPDASEELADVPTLASEWQTQLRIRAARLRRGRL
jgi:MOSC domain-containing protein YiiM